MPQTTSTIIHDELFVLENELWDELCRLFRDVDHHRLEGNSCKSKRAHFDNFKIGEDGELSVSFLVLGRTSAYDCMFDDLTSEDLTRARALAKRIRQLKNALPREGRVGGNRR